MPRSRYRGMGMKPLKVSNLAKSNFKMKVPKLPPTMRPPKASKKSVSVSHMKDLAKRTYADERKKVKEQKRPAYKDMLPRSYQFRRELWDGKHPGPTWEQINPQYLLQDGTRLQIVKQYLSDPQDKVRGFIKLPRELDGTCDWCKLPHSNRAKQCSANHPDKLSEMLLFQTSDTEPGGKIQVYDLRTHVHKYTLILETWIVHDRFRSGMFTARIMPLETDEVYY